MSATATAAPKAAAKTKKSLFQCKAHGYMSDPDATREAQEHGLRMHKGRMHVAKKKVTKKAATKKPTVMTVVNTKSAKTIIGTGNVVGRLQMRWLQRAAHSSPSVATALLQCIGEVAKVK